MNGREIEDENCKVVRVAGHAYIGINAALPVVSVDPAEAFRIEVELIKRWLAAIKPVHVADVEAQSVMGRMSLEGPVDFGVVVPFGPLPEFATHKKELLAGL
jgi:hypothetical protein